jgi:circadian clock protein KaiC
MRASGSLAATTKVPSGVAFFDRHFGGVYENRCWLLGGPGGTGKSLIALQFLHEGIQKGEKGLLLTIQRAGETVVWAASHGRGMDRAIESGQCLILEYADYIPGRDPEPVASLPPEGFLELQEIVRANAIQRIVLDTVVPWSMTTQPRTQAERVFSLVRALDRLGATTLLTLPEPVSPAALRLRDALVAVVPIAVTLSLSLETGERRWTTEKYLGERPPFPIHAYELAGGLGAVEAHRPGATASAAASAHPAEPSNRPRLSPVVLGPSVPDNRAPDRTSRFGLNLPD